MKRKHPFIKIKEGERKNVEIKDTKIKNIIKTQLEKSNKARFRVVLGDENKLRITSGWLFRMDLRSYSLKPLGRF